MTTVPCSSYREHQSFHRHVGDGVWVCDGCKWRICAQMARVGLARTRAGSEPAADGSTDLAARPDITRTEPELSAGRHAGHSGNGPATVPRLRISHTRTAPLGRTRRLRISQRKA